MSEILEKIKSRGYLRVVIHPSAFVEKRIEERAALLPILEKTSVQLKGWNFPHIDGFCETQSGTDWIGQEINWDSIVELWRFYQSGQFVHYSGMLSDWSKHTGTFTGMPSQWDSDVPGAPHVLLDIKEVIVRLAEIFEFAARLASTEAGDRQMHLKIEFNSIEHYLLRVSPNNEVDRFRGMVDPTPKIPFELDLNAIDLKSNTKELALKPAAELFGLFGWKPGISILRDIKSELLYPSQPKARWL